MVRTNIADVGQCFKPALDLALANVEVTGYLFSHAFLYTFCHLRHDSKRHQFGEHSNWQVGFKMIFRTIVPDEVFFGLPDVIVDSRQELIMIEPRTWNPMPGRWHKWREVVWIYVSKPPKCVPQVIGDGCAQCNFDAINCLNYKQPQIGIEFVKENGIFKAGTRDELVYVVSIMIPLFEGKEIGAQAKIAFSLQAM